jgi:uncharacterized SAM-binding protein YcdF (DUF218 family)
MQNNLIIVHGEKSLHDGSMHRAFKERLDKAIDLINQGNYEELLITGGCTRANVISEAEMGKQYLQDKTNLPIYLEDKSHTTIENIIFTHQHAKGHCEQINHAVIITSNVRIPRVRYLYKKFWPELFPRITFIGTKGHYPPYYFLVELLYWIYDIFDPKERYLSKYTKHIFRNT